MTTRALTLGALTSLLLFVATLDARLAAAQPAGATQFQEAAPGDAPSDEETLITLSAGATLNTGNTRAIAGNIGAALSLKREDDVFSASLSFNYGRAALRGMDGTFADMQTNTENLQGRVRYDRYLSDDDALFVAVLGRRDRFAGLDGRVQAQLGYLRNFFLEEEGKHRLWGEAGYDLSYDDYYPNPLLDPMGNALEGDALVHSARLFFGYENRVNDNVTFKTGVEGLMNVEDLEDTRIEWKSALTSDLSDALKLSLEFALGYDHQPVPGRDELDTLTTLNIVLSLDASEEDEVPPEAPAAP